MTRRLPQIFAGDYVRAVKRLRADDDETRRSIARCLGLLDEETPAKTAAPTEQKKKTDGQEARREESKKEVKKDGDKVKPPPVEGGKAVASELEMISAGELPPGAPDWLRLSGSLRASVAKTAADAGADPAPEPLLAPLWVRGILTALLSTRGIDGPPDVDRAVEAIARGELVTELPRLHSLTTRRGVQLLIDMGDGMLPFGRDQSELARDVSHVIGEDAASVLRFTGTPLRGAGTGSRRRWKAYEPPLAGTPVLLLTDLGIGRPAAGPTPAATVEEWLEFAELLRRADCPVVALVPYPAARWPAPLARAMYLVEWDRPTSVATARRLVGRGLEVKR